MTSKMTPLRLAGMFHSHYERLAPEFDHETQLETRTFRPCSPHGQLMIEVCKEILAHWE